MPIQDYHSDADMEEIPPLPPPLEFGDDVCSPGASGIMLHTIKIMCI